MYRRRAHALKWIALALLPIILCSFLLWKASASASASPLALSTLGYGDHAGSSFLPIQNADGNEHLTAFRDLAEVDRQIHPSDINSPFPSDPPDASKISIGDPDIGGYATVTGTDGAVGAESTVVVVNLKASTLMTTTADEHGAFSLALFAPPGSSLLVKADPQGELAQALWAQAQRWDDRAADVSYFNPLPGTIIHVGGPPPSDGKIQAFHSVGRIGADEGWTGWWFSGTLERSGSDPGPYLSVMPGQSVTVTGQLNVTAPGYECSSNPSMLIHGTLGLQYLFSSDGRALPWGSWFTAHLFTPTGLPIEHEASGEVTDVVHGQHFNSLTCTSDHTFQGKWVGAFSVPTGLREGAYLPHLTIFGDVPVSSDVPSAVVWYRWDESDALPPIWVGDMAPPHIPWTLLGDYPVNGHRGLQAREDVGHYQMPTRTRYPPHRVVIPRLDERSGDPLVYRLEPGSHWLSATDRRHPNPPHIPLQFPSGELMVEVLKPDGSVDVLGPEPIVQSTMRSPTLPDGSALHEGTGHIGNLYHLTSGTDTFDYSFEQYGEHTIYLAGTVSDIYGHPYPIEGTYDVTVARVLDLDPAQLPTTPYEQGNAFAPGLHIYPPVPADVQVHFVHMPDSNPEKAVENTISGTANRHGYFHPPVGTAITLDTPGEYRVDWSATYIAEDGTHWAGFLTWGNVVEGHDAKIAAHGRRGMDYKSDTIDDMPAWFEVYDLYDNRQEKIGIEVYYPYFSGDVHWGAEDSERTGDSIHSIITVEDLTASGEIYDLLLDHYPRATNTFRWPPIDTSLNGLISRTLIGEAPLFITTESGVNPAVAPEDIDLWGYWYGSSERPDVHVRELISEDNMGTAYWRFNDTYAQQIGEPADGDQPGDIKWEFGGAVLRTVSKTSPADEIHEYAIYSSFWVLLPHEDAQGPRVTPPFQDATGASINGGPLLTLMVDGEASEIDMLFLAKCVRPGDILETGDTIAFCGHVGPPLNSRVSVLITSPSGVELRAQLRASKVGWVYDPGFDVQAWESGRWTVDVQVVHDRPYIGNGITPDAHNTGTVMGSNGRYEFYVVDPESPGLVVFEPSPGFLEWPSSEIEPVVIQGIASPATEEVRYTIYDKGVIMGQGTLLPGPDNVFTLDYDAVALHEQFPMVSLTAHDGRRPGLADEVTISLFSAGEMSRAGTVTLIGEQVFVSDAGDGNQPVFLPLISIEP